MRRSPLPVLLLTAALGQASAHLATVLPGDTLSGLAVRFGVSSRSIADANHLVGSNPELRAGQTLDIPGAAHYTVQPGDTPWSIAQRADMPLTQLEALNPSIASGMVQVGMVLQLSGTALPAVQAAPAKAAAVAATSYVVRSGDTLWGIAQKLGISVATLTALNPQAATAMLQPGMILKLRGRPAPPSLPTSGYRVASGDTLWGIASSLGISVAELERLNPQTVYQNLQPGTVLRVPAQVQAKSSPAKAAAVAATSYVVRSGDTLWGIAQKLGISVATLTALNPQAATAMLQPGMILKLRGRPAPPSLPTSGYRVASGDTLWGIASSLGISVAELERLNPQTVYQNLQPGTVLRVPAQVQAKSSPAKAPAIPTSGYRVASGDTLWGIASSLGISVAELLRLNPEIASSTLVAGSTLQVPARPGKRKRPAPAPTNRVQTAHRVQIKDAPNYQSAVVARQVAAATAHPGLASATYTVRPGDTLSAIASRYHVSVVQLEADNPQVQSGVLQVGQQLHVPTFLDRLRSFGSRVVSVAERFLGVPYVWGGSSPTGFDCSGLVQYVYRLLGYQLPRTSEAQWNAVQHVSKPKPGDLIFMNFPGDYQAAPNHVGLYVGHGKMLNAPYPGQPVQIDSVPWGNVMGYGQLTSQ
jgi:LysM repeat protein